MFRIIRAPSRSLYQTLTCLLTQSQSQSYPSSIHPTLPNPSSPFNSILPSPFSHSPTRQKHGESTNSNRKLFVVQPRVRPDSVLKLKLNEALNLASSLEQRPDDCYDDELSHKKKPPYVVVQNPAARSIRPGTYFGQGTVHTIKCLLNEVNSKDEVVGIFVNATLTGIQQRNLEIEWDIPVLDRVGLIIDIFKAHAQTKEAKLQAELAALMYQRTRLVRSRGPDGRNTFGASGEAQVVSARGRGSGGQGFISGAGETELQLQRRRIIFLRTELLSKIKEVRRTRAVQRASRKRHGGLHGQDMPTVAIVGYTNAGKSTLVSALSQTYLYSDDRLFATVDPKLRSVILPSGKKVLLSDTVGFISDLPVQLVEAFQATLEEVVEADLLVHVLDSSAPNIDEHKETVLQVLQQIGVSEEKIRNMVEVWNKIDLQQQELADSYSDTEDNFNSLDDADDDDTATGLSHGDVEDNVDDEVEDDYSDGWLLDDQPDTWDNDDHKTGKNSSCNDDQQKESLIVNNLQSENESGVARVETSAVTGIGLQELLEVIDDRLKNQRLVESNVVDRKWRPPRDEDSGIAVEN